MTAEWSRYIPEDSNCETSNKWVALDSLRHTAHLSAARRIAEDELVTSQLIYDGVLTNTRTKGVFLSPNDWGDGYIYGSIQFTVPIKSALGGRNLYWLEVINSYSIPILRFLVSRSNNVPINAKPYDPLKDSGPIQSKGGILYRPTDCVIEIILDEDIQLSAFSSLAFVSHHSDFCVRKNKNCLESGGGHQRAWAAMMGHLMCHSLISLNPLLTTDGTLTDQAKTGLFFLWGAMTRNNTTFEGPVTDDDSARYLLQAAMADLFKPNTRKCGRALVAMIDSEDRFDSAFEKAIRNHFGVPNFSLSELED